MLLWLTELAAERQLQQPESDHPVTRAEKSFQDFAARHGQSLKYRLDDSSSLLGIAYSMALSLHESIQPDHGLNNADKKKLESEFVRDFGGYETQKDSYSITVRNFDPKPTAFSLLHRVRNGLAHSRYEFDGESINIKDKEVADFSLPTFSLYNFVYGCSRSILTAAQNTGLYVSR